MQSNDYHFVTDWHVQATREEIFNILSNATDLMRWWPSVYLDVQVAGEGEAQVVSLYTKGWLPYTLRWQFRTTQVDFPNGFALEAWGDFVGGGQWTFEQEGEWVKIRYVWSIRADKPILRRLSPIFKPIFAANHRWAMAKGEESLRLELARRHAKTPEERSRIPAPPQPTFTFLARRWQPVGGEKVVRG